MQHQLLNFKGVISSIKVICKLDSNTPVSCHDTHIYFAAQTKHLVVVYHGCSKGCSASPIAQAVGTAGSLTVPTLICSPGLLTVVQVARNILRKAAAVAEKGSSLPQALCLQQRSPTALTPGVFAGTSTLLWLQGAKTHPDVPQLDKTLQHKAEHGQTAQVLLLQADYCSLHRH